MQLKQAAATSGWLHHPFGVPPAYRHWLMDHGSLTARLKSRCPRFSVRVVRAGLLRANADECAALGLRGGERAYVREVVLSCDGLPVVFAHSVVPAVSLRQAWASVTRLGTRPLGEALFGNPRVARGAMQYRGVDGRHALAAQARRADLELKGRLWARRSVFLLDGHPLMVTEVFLPRILGVGE